MQITFGGVLDLIWKSTISAPNSYIQVHGRIRPMCGQADKIHLKRWQKHILPNVAIFTSPGVQRLLQNRNAAQLWAAIWGQWNRNKKIQLWEY